MSYVGTSRQRVQVAGGRWGNGGTVLSGTGEFNIIHRLAGVRICGANLGTSSPAGTANNTRWTHIRVSGTALCIRVLSRGAATAAITNQGYWFAVS